MEKNKDLYYYDSVNLPPRNPAPIGTGIEKKYGWKAKENGVPKLEVVGETNVYEYIQSNEDACDINSIIKRYESGDLTALNAKQAFYGDFRNIPYYPEDIEKLVSGVKKIYDENEDIKNSYKDFDGFLEAIRSDKVVIKKKEVNGNA